LLDFLGEDFLAAFFATFLTDFFTAFLAALRDCFFAAFLALNFTAFRAFVTAFLSLTDDLRAVPRREDAAFLAFDLAALFLAPFLWPPECLFPPTPNPFVNVFSLLS
jgi:hypothetical protein